MICFCRYDVVILHKLFTDWNCYFYNFTLLRKIYLSGPPQVRWGLIWPSTPKSLPTPDISELFTKDSDVKGAGGHTLKLGKPGCLRDSRKYFFSHRVVGCWNSLDQEMVDAPSVNAFKGRHDKVRQTRVGMATWQDYHIRTTPVLTSVLLIQWIQVCCSDTVVFPWAFSWTNPLSPRPRMMIGSPVRPHKVRY